MDKKEIIENIKRLEAKCVDAKMVHLKAVAELEKAKATALEYIVEIENPEDEIEEERKITAAGKRMRVKSRRDKRAAMYWSFRLKTGIDNRSLIEDGLEHAPNGVEKARVAAVKKLRGFADAYPERAASLCVTKGETK